MAARLGLYCPALPPATGGLPDHTAALAAALAGRGVGGVLLGLTGRPDLPAGWTLRTGVPARRGAAGLLAAAREEGLAALVLQYVPFLYARRGISPALVGALRELTRGGVKLAVYLHEPYVPFTRLPWLVTGWPMRWQFRAVMRRAAVIVSPVPRFLALARAVAHPGTACAIAPVGATIPVSPETRADARARLGLDPGATIVGAFSPAASGFRRDWVIAAATALRQAAPAATWLCFGHGSATLAAALAPAAVRDLGSLSAVEAARAMRALDLAVAPFVDGLTLRRTSAMAALAAGIPLVSSGGPLFDPSLAAAAESPADAGGFAQSVVALVGDPARRATLGERGRRFYESDASTLVGARRLAGMLGLAA